MDRLDARLLIVGLSLVFLSLAAASWIYLWSIVSTDPSNLAVDFRAYSEHTRRWLATGQFYLPHQLAGPGVQDGDPLYPPLILYLLLPFQVLSEPLWWMMPLGLVVAIVASFRPAPWTWPILALILAWPRTPALIYFGNPGMWMVAAIAAALKWRWPGPLVLIKPSLAPFALIGIGSRGWLIVLGLLVLAAIPFGALWLDYITVLRNASLPLGYSLADLPLALAPVIAWIGKTSKDQRST